MDGATNSGINYPQIYSENNLIGIVWEGLGSGTAVFFNASDVGVVGIDPANAINVTNSNGSQSKPDIAIENGVFHIVYSELSGSELKYCRVGTVNGAAEINNDLMSIYPNPTNGSMLTIELPKSESIDVNVQLFDFSGRSIFNSAEQLVNGKITLNLETVSAGTYLIQVNDGNMIYESKIMK